MTMREWLDENNAQLCHIEIGGWATDIPVPKEWTVETVAKIIKQEAKIE